MEGEPKIPTRAALGRLNPIACATLALRCAKRVEPLYKAVWRSAPIEILSLVEQALERVEMAIRSIASDADAAYTSADIACTDAHVAATAAAGSAAYTANNVANAVKNAARAAKSAATDAINTAATAESYIYAHSHAVDAAVAINGEASLIANAAADFALLDGGGVGVAEQIRGALALLDAPIWVKTTPKWYIIAVETAESDVNQSDIPEFKIISPGPIMVDSGSANPEDLAELFAELSVLYRMIGGSGIRFDYTETHVREPALV